MGTRILLYFEERIEYTELSGAEYRKSVKHHHCIITVVRIKSLPGEIPTSDWTSRGYDEVFSSTSRLS